MSKSLRTYQIDAVEAIEQAVAADQSRALVVMATGLGKTVVVAESARRWQLGHRKPVLFLVHLWEAVDQAVEEFRDTFGPDTRIQVLRGPTKRIDPLADVVFSTFQTMRRRYERIPRETFGLLIVDECHHSKADTYEPIVEYFDADRIGVTATEERMDGRDIRDLFDAPVYEYPLSRALAERTLSDVEYRVLVDNISPDALRKIEQRLEKNEGRITRGMIDREVFLAERLDLIVERIREEQKTRRRTIIFCNSRKHANAVSKHFPEARTYYTGLPRQVLQDRFLAFKRGEITTLLVVNKLNEAVDVPEADLIAFLRMTESRTIWLQQLGRGMRRVVGKDLLVLDFVANCDRVRVVGQLAGDVNRWLGVPDDTPIIHRTGLTFTFSAELRDLLSLLKRVEVDYYTFEEARAAVAALNPPWDGSLKKWYVAMRKVDQRLPYSPEEHYSGKGWVSWRHFCDRDFFSFNDARSALVKLNPPSVGDLVKWYKTAARPKDRRFPSHPHRYYANSGWSGIHHFCGVKEPERYRTFAEERAAVARLGPPWSGNLAKWHRTVARKKDARLHANPDQAFLGKGWVSWPHFCDREPYSFQEARKLLAKLDPPSIEVRRWYKEVCRTNPRFPKNPARHYAKSGWVSWPHFLGKKQK